MPEFEDQRGRREEKKRESERDKEKEKRNEHEKGGRATAHNAFLLVWEWTRVEAILFSVADPTLSNAYRRPLWPVLNFNPSPTSLGGGTSPPVSSARD